MARYTYSRWDGSQQVFELDEDALLDALSEDILAHGDVNRALRDLLRRGMRNEHGERIDGLRNLMERLRQQRQRQLERYNLDSLMGDLKERLRDVVDTERKGIERRMAEARRHLEELGDDDLKGPMRLLEERAQRSKEQLDGLPESPGGAIKELTDYEFMDPEAQGKFQEILDMLQRQMLQNMFQSIKQQLQGMSPEDMEGVKEMIGALNQMIRDRAMGVDPDFEGFMEQYGYFFDPDRPASLDELIERISQQMTAMQSLMQSMSPEMRGELEALLEPVIDSELMAEMAELAASIYQIMPVDDLAQEYPFMGDESLTLEQAMELMGQLQDMDELERQMQHVIRRGEIDDIDPAKVEEQLGEEARRQLERLQDIVRRLKDAGTSGKRVTACTSLPAESASWPSRR